MAKTPMTRCRRLGHEYPKGLPSGCPRCAVIRSKAWAERNPDRAKKAKTDYYERNREAVKARSKAHYEANREACTKANVERTRKYRAANPLVRLAVNLRHRLWTALKSRRWVKSSVFTQYIGCSLEELRTHLDLTWSRNYPGLDQEGQKIHIDHIIPLSTATTEQELYNLCHYSNLQLLLASDNLCKGRKYG